MTIKSDKWIRHMAESTGMIEPFEPGQIRSNAAILSFQGWVDSLSIRNANRAI